ncbi:uncharacterized protein LOC130672165 [Microplitis mediator]|uniref:uncharacterized protein LOC130667853 n=1 Tax=Microplitis mediator TaxID=375433 RepID=UPI002555E392|nr:uncharacterized protein LOC130667853 [Microplitis mediator]XP_057332511.1 uncharacterized protein LOC130672165 [Microplitis mediator]
MDPENDLKLLQSWNLSHLYNNFEAANLHPLWFLTNEDKIHEVITNQSDASQFKKCLKDYRSLVLHHNDNNNQHYSNSTEQSDVFLTASSELPQPAYGAISVVPSIDNIYPFAGNSATLMNVDYNTEIPASFPQPLNNNSSDPYLNEIDSDEGETITEDDVAQLNLEEYLKSSTKGCAILLALKNGSQSLLNTHRNQLTRLIIDRELGIAKAKFGNDLTISQFNITKKKFLIYTKSIKNLCPTERRKSYYVGYKKIGTIKCLPKGKLYRHFEFRKSTLRKDGVLISKPRANENLTSNVTDETDLNTLKLLEGNFNTFNDVKDLWSKSFSDRSKLLKYDRVEIHVYMNRFKVLKSPFGYELLSIDFSRLFPGKEDNFNKNWPPLKLKLIKLLTENKKITNPEDLAHLGALDAIIGERQDAILCHLLPYLVPVTYVDIPEEQILARSQGPKKRRITKRRASYEESRNDLFIVTPNVGSVESLVNKRKEELSSQHRYLQPVPIFVGTLRNVEDAYVILNDTLYHVKSVVNAISLTIRICHSLDCSYPPAAKNLWLFLQNAGFGISLPNDNLPTALETLIGQVSI